MAEAGLVQIVSPSAAMACVEVHCRAVLPTVVSIDACPGGVTNIGRPPNESIHQVDCAHGRSWLSQDREQRHVCPAGASTCILAQQLETYYNLLGMSTISCRMLVSTVIFSLWRSGRLASGAGAGADTWGAVPPRTARCARAPEQERRAAAT